ncbi:MAG: L-seryl-tRNA(Sec) selenium transferase [Chloracidobacterium sp.]|nr:L-seryl-tRNA(Sec) selenium transferase [Chloracidobacterium sp.]
MPSSVKETNSIMRNLPSVDELLRSSIAQDIAGSAGERHAATLCRGVIEQIRLEIGKPSGKEDTKDSLLALSEQRLASEWQTERLSGVSRVINATGVVIHTNLGRAPLSENARRAVTDASGYCTLEYDIQTGKRGRRGRRAESLLAELTGAEDVLIVNNCAAAAFFVLTAFASGGEVVISRGELVEIGGDFRVPDVLKQSRAKLHEVGTTNRTKIADYQEAINAKTRLILRVHPSNYRIVGFTAMPNVGELAELAHSKGILLYEDIGSGALVDMSEFGLGDEPVVARSIADGADIVTFSGDKLLGGPQSGIIAGKSELIARLRKHPLYRALRVDKLAYAALEATLDAYRREAVLDEVPVLKMLSMSKDEIAKRVERFAKQLEEKLNGISDLKFEILDGVSAVGGGAAPNAELHTTLIALSHRKLKPQRLEQLLRKADPPVIARIVDDKVMIDLRTVSDSEETQLLKVFNELR